MSAIEWPVKFGESPFLGYHDLCEECDGRGWVMDELDWRTTCWVCGGWGYTATRDDNEDEYP